jgi:hypothetical protein
MSGRWRDEDDGAGAVLEPFDVDRFGRTADVLVEPGAPTPEIHPRLTSR